MEDTVIGRERGLVQVVVEKLHSIRDLDSAVFCCDYLLAPIMFK